MTLPPAETPGAGIPEKKALSEAFDALVSATAAKQLALDTPEPRPRRSRLPLLIAGLAALFLGVIVLRGREDPDPRPATTAALRADMVVMARRIRAFEAEHGRSPRTLREIGAAPAALSYRIINAETWELRGARGADTLTLRSGQDPAAFLRDSPRPPGEPVTP